MKQVSLPLYNGPPRIVGDCDGQPGVCLVMRCRENLTLQVTRAGSIRIPGSGVCLPVRVTSDGVGPVSRAVRALCSNDDDPVTEAVLARVERLMARYGSTCWRDVQRVLGPEPTLEQLAEVWEVTNQAVSLWEHGARERVREELG